MSDKEHTDNDDLEPQPDPKARSLSEIEDELTRSQLTEYGKRIGSVEEKLDRLAEKVRQLVRILKGK